jgi:hypothetical protein
MAASARVRAAVMNALPRSQSREEISRAFTWFLFRRGRNQRTLNMLAGISVALAT